MPLITYTFVQSSSLLPSRLMYPMIKPAGSSSCSKSFHVGGRDESQAVIAAAVAAASLNTAAHAQVQPGSPDPAKNAVGLVYVSALAPDAGYGIDLLRIADASILPNVPSGNTKAPCVVIGERAADIIRRAHGI